MEKAFKQQLLTYNISSRRVMPIVVSSVIVDMLGYITVISLVPCYARARVHVLDESLEKSEGRFGKRES